MLLTSLLLLLSAAALHAVSNAFLKQARDKLAFAWWMLGVFCVLGAPLVFFTGAVPAAGWEVAILSGLLEAVYFITLGRAYTHGDLSVVYPVARGSAPLFLLLWASLFLGEKPSPAGLAGILSIVAGLYLINLPSIHQWSRPLTGFKTPATRWALLTGVLISAYTAIDKVGVRYFSPAVYLYFVLLVCWIALSVQWFNRERRMALAEEIQRDPEISAWQSRPVFICGSALLGTTAYTLVLAAMKLSPVSYVGPVREVSVILGAWIGVRFMRERGGSLRIAASVLVALGILLIAIKG